MNQLPEPLAGADPGEGSRRLRVLVFVVAYYAESTLTWVLNRIPKEVFESFDCEVLVVDDGSQDRTYEIGEEYRREHPEIRLTVLRNELNQGYGGNQKIGYTYALRRGFDVVVLIHGDGQYAPEELPRLLGPLVAGEADAVFGSRMMKPREALRGGMPLYKFLGNRALTWLENMLLGTRLSEFHSGYRIYSVHALARLPFLLNTDDFHFDTEIIVQLLGARQRIVELPIPTYYGGEICRVNGIRYAWNVFLAVVRSTLHRAGVLYQRRYDCLPDDNTHYDLKLGYLSSHTAALQAIPDGASVVDIGGGPGELDLLLAARGCRVLLVDRVAPPRELPGVEFVQQDLDQPLEVDIRPYRYLLLLDIIEHLREPERFLRDLRRQFDERPRTLILTTPNIAFVVQRLMLLLGQFNYGRVGVLDRTHSRLFTFRTVRRALREEGFRIMRVRGIPAPFPKVLGPGRLGRLAVALNRALIALSRTWFSYQIYVEAECRPDVDFFLRGTATGTSGSPPGPGNQA
ncbi:MAG: bifunctional glycosyltransferase/class I SAM-dependent methyltransferase [Thermoanaerobaculaceae bacterium]|nr:bifunctional glycosyltransferase/class I SAM-dependent methyltransferase [Thermoanaerobaculaceae bacterium]